MICVTCVISWLLSQNSLILLIYATSVIGVTSVISKKLNFFKKLGTVTCVIHVTSVISLWVSPNGLVLIIKPTSVIGVTYVISQKNIHVPKIRDRNMCDLCNLCDFIIIESKWSYNAYLSNQRDWCNFCDLTKKTSSKN